jgi:hypothetical protein
VYTNDTSNKFLMQKEGREVIEGEFQTIVLMLVQMEQ